MRSEAKLYNVKLKFLPGIAYDVAQVQWHSTQTITFENDGSAIVEFRVDGLDEITWWILSYGDQVKVLRPPLSLDLDVAHYWRVDEVNEAETPTTWESNIWSFTTSDHIVVDDFESCSPESPYRLGSDLESATVAHNFH